MASSEVEICSNGLIRLGDAPINSFSETNDRALLCANLWDGVRDAVLRSANWNCALKRVILSPESIAPAYGWTNRFKVPGDFLRIVSIGQDPQDQTEYEFENNEILSDESAIYLRYVFRNENVARYDALLVEALEIAMAQACAYPITKSGTVVEGMSKLLNEKLRQARAVDGQENPPETLGQSTVLLQRGV